MSSPRAKDWLEGGKRAEVVHGDGQPSDDEKGFVSRTRMLASNSATCISAVSLLSRYHGARAQNRVLILVHVWLTVRVAVSARDPCHTGVVRRFYDSILKRSERDEE